MPSHRDRSDQPTVELAVVFTDVETDKAYKVIDPASNEAIWIPFSQTIERHRDKNNHGTIVITEWIARQKGLVE